MLADRQGKTDTAERRLSVAGIDPYGASYTIRGFLQEVTAHGLCTTSPIVGCTFLRMASDAEWRRRIGQRIQELRNLKGWSLSKLAVQTSDRLTKSQVSNYEQGARMPGPEEATVIGEALGESPAHILCLDDEMPVLSKTEAKLIQDLRALPENERALYAQRIAILASAYKVPVPNERVLRYEYNPGKRPNTPKM